MRKILMTSILCFTFLAPSVVMDAQDDGGKKKKEETKKEKKEECKDDSCKKPAKNN